MPPVKIKCFDYGDKEVDYLTKADPVLGAVMAKLGHIEREVIPDLFSALIYAVIGQLVTVQAANTVWGRFQNRIGDLTPAKVVTFSADEIQQCGMTMKKATIIHALASKVQHRELDLDELPGLPDDAVIRRLTALHGVGQWTAEMLLLNSMERPDVISWGDVAIRRGMEKLYGIPLLEKADFARYRAIYSPYASVASIYLWNYSFNQNSGILV